MRTAAGGPTLLLPRSLGGLWVSLLGLPLRAVGEFDEKHPLVGAIVAVRPAEQQDELQLAVALAIRVRSGQRFVAQASMGSEATYTAMPRRADGLVVLRPRRTETASRWGLDFELGVVGDYAVIGWGTGGLDHAGAYAARTLTQRPAAQWPDVPSAWPGPPREAAPAGAATPRAAASSRAPPDTPSPLGSSTALPDGPNAGSTDRPDVVLSVGQAALQGPVRTWLQQRIQWLRSWKHPTANAVLDPESLGDAVLDLLAELSALSVALRVGSSSVTLSARLRAADAKAQDRLRALPSADPLQLLELPDDCMLAAAWVQQRPSRLRAATRAQKRLTESWGSDLSADETAMIHQAVEDLAAGRGDETLAGIRCTGAGMTGFARGPVADAKQLSRGIDALHAFRRHPAVVQRLAAASLELSSNKLRLPNVPHDVRRLRLSPLSPTSPSSPDGGAPHAAGELAERDPVDLLLAVGSSQYWVAAGWQARETLLHLHEPDPERVLRLNPAAKRMMSAVGERVWLVVLSDPLAMAACASGRPAVPPLGPISVAAGPLLGKDGADGFVLVDATLPLVQSLAQWADR